jgi:SAM-dependent methyltransferase
MTTRSINQSAEFYGSNIGRVNARIMGSSCAAINREMLETFGRPTSAIFMGLGDGTLVERLAPSFERSTVVEASDKLVVEAQMRFSTIPGLAMVNAYFESYDLEPKDRVSCVLGNHVLEHVDDPVKVLRKSRGWLKPDGIAIFTVPNATSLHRRIGVELGMLERVSDPSDQDRVIGHQRVYDAPRLHTDIVEADFVVVEEGGFNLKLVSQAQMAGWPESLHDAIYHVSRECPADLCSNLYVVCRPR